MTNIAINGFGRIGRAFLKLALTHSDLNIVAVNDLGDAENLAYLLRFDSAYGRYGQPVSIEESDGKKFLVIGSRRMMFLQEKDPLALPWEALGVDIVVEATGVFESFEKARVHLEAGAKRVVLTAPAKDDDGPDARTVLMGVNADALKTCTLSSNGSCTTNSASPVLQILTEKLGVKKAFLNTGTGALHANFKLNLAGEAICLYAPEGTLVDAVTFTNQISDVSEGRSPDGSTNIVAQLPPTPRGSNVMLGYLDMPEKTREVMDLLEISHLASRNVEHPLYNLTSWNLGFHTAHHMYPGIHWSRLPALHARIRPNIPSILISQDLLPRLDHEIPREMPGNAVTD